mmetsp:Transcript_6112/g.12253  ORF Transcript_6112/g.12253 Transcript_6112/m.12253 type:complete len:164 (+) Transcript_6112:146-637(+)|eukprot:scaffold2780_cov174-Amphora_coffeaeformis.AAC.5
MMQQQLDKELQAVEAAATAAVELVQNFSEQDPSDPRSCWKNPAQMLEQLNAARIRAVQAWQVLEQTRNHNKESSGDTTSNNEQDLRAQFMDMVTDAFADVLAEMKDQENIDLDVLVDCLQSGMDILSQEDREFLMDNNNDSEEEETPHEVRRREQGFHVETTA